MYIYGFINEFFEEGDSLYTKDYGEVKFKSCEKGIIHCILDNEFEVHYNSVGQACWWSEKNNCWRYDDESAQQLFL